MKDFTSATIQLEKWELWPAQVKKQSFHRVKDFTSATIQLVRGSLGRLKSKQNPAINSFLRSCIWTQKDDAQMHPDESL